MYKQMISQSRLILALILMVLISRLGIEPLFGHLPNVSAVDATALFCGAYIANRRAAIALMFLIVCTTDLFINKWLTGIWTLFYSGFYWQYASYMMITLIGSCLIANKSLQIIGAALSSALLFFLVSNFGVWYQGLLYPQTLNGLLDCYIAAIPFLKNTLCGDLFFTIILFGGMKLFNFTLSSKLRSQATQPK